MHVLVHEEYASQVCTSARKREDRLANFNPWTPCLLVLDLWRGPACRHYPLSAHAWGYENPLVDPCVQKGGDLRGTALESLASSRRGHREMTSAALIPFVIGREVSSPCGTPASHTTRVNLEEVAQCRLVLPCLGLVRRTASFPNQCASGFS